MARIGRMGEETKRIENPCDENSRAALPPLQDGDGMFSPHLEFPSEILNEAGQRPFGPWPHVNFEAGVDVSRGTFASAFLYDHIEKCYY